MEAPIKIEFDHRVEEHVSASRLYYSKRTRWAKTDKVVAFLLVLFGTVLVILVGFQWWSVIWFVLAALEFFNLLSIDPLVVRWQFKATPKFNERNTIVFEHDGIHFRTPTIDARLKWETYSEMLENDEVFLLVYGKRMYSVIPKRAFQGETEKERFRHLIAQRLSAASA
jgi:hypothetical protein